MAKHPDSGLVAVSWLKTVSTIEVDKIGTALPADTSTWSASGFVVVDTVGGTPDPYNRIRPAIISISSFAVAPNSSRTPWGQAQELSERILAAFYDTNSFGGRLATRSGYYDVSVRTGFPTTEPRKIPGNESSYAHVQFDCQLTWVALEDA